MAAVIDARPTAPFRLAGFRPRRSEAAEQPDGLHSFYSPEAFLPNQSSEGAPRFNRRSPPHDHARELALKATSLCGRGL